jgi:hypothetical protein
MTPPNWTNVTVSLSSLVPWEHNPRTMTKAEAKRLVKSRNKLGQFQTIAIGPDGQVYDGHQRLSAWLTVYGKDSAIDARQSDRPLTDEERRELTINANEPAGAWGDEFWTWPELGEWGFDTERLARLNSDAANLRVMLQSDEPIDPMAEWVGMPEFEQEDQLGAQTIKIHFQSLDDRDLFSKVIDQPVTDKTKYIWYPELEKKSAISEPFTDES